MKQYIQSAKRHPPVAELVFTFSQIVCGATHVTSQKLRQGSYSENRRKLNGVSTRGTLMSDTKIWIIFSIMISYGFRDTSWIWIIFPVLRFIPLSKRNFRISLAPFYTSGVRSFYANRLFTCWIMWGNPHCFTGTGHCPSKSRGILFIGSLGEIRKGKKKTPIKEGQMTRREMPQTRSMTQRYCS